MTTRYMRKSAATIIDAMQVSLMRAGNHELTIDMPCREGANETLICSLGFVTVGWGDSEPVLILEAAEGVRARMPLTADLRERLQARQAECDRTIMAAIRSLSAEVVK